MITWITNTHQVSNQNMGQMIGQDKTYCGKETPPNFFSYGSAAQIKIQIDSETHGLVPEFRAKIKPEFKPEFKAEICDRIYTDTLGVIFSPNHPDLYPNQLDCTIQISLKDPQLKIQVRDSRTDK